ncbi:hypothetical protein EUGRSUZ_H04556 [Eucalyptus grandis]|uniref:Uncharacterized protein n=2 Tax=Eucalyptus grandis TaxID=71139 RepID=A0ACC3JXH4_EUCGR|nr:hypothetical protein EUGRSUZ_H04556 [Eucalyptus grandis]
MEFTLSGNDLKTLARSITCLSRVGNDLAIQAFPSQISFHILNSSRSAYQLITFKPDLFDVFTVSGTQVQCSAVCSVLRTPISNIDYLSVQLPDINASKVQWALQRKYPSNFVVRPRDLNRLLVNFQSSLQEITVIATERKSDPSDAASEFGGKAVEFRSYIDPTKENDSLLHTQLWIDPAEEFVQYAHNSNPVDVTFAFKELKAFLAFCEECEVDIHLPILMAPKFGIDEGDSSNFDVTLVLATMLTSQLHEANTGPSANECRARLASFRRNILKAGGQSGIERISTIQISKAASAEGNIKTGPDSSFLNHWVDANKDEDDHNEDGDEISI